MDGWQILGNRGKEGPWRGMGSRLLQGVELREVKKADHDPSPVLGSETMWALKQADWLCVWCSALCNPMDCSLPGSYTDRKALNQM